MEQVFSYGENLLDGRRVTISLKHSLLLMVFHVSIGNERKSGASLYINKNAIKQQGKAFLNSKQGGFDTKVEITME